MMIENKVAKSGIITFKPEDYAPPLKIVSFDIVSFLFKGLMLKEKDFREDLKNYNWAQLKDNNVAVFCSNDAIVPKWAYMLVASYLQENGIIYYFGKPEIVTLKSWLDNINKKVNIEDYVDKRVVIKGCGELEIPEEIYLELSKKFIPVVKSLMFGEPCSTVPIYKKPRKTV